MKKIAVMIYPYFSMQEISCLTDGLKVYFNIDVEVFASSKEVITSEDNFQVIANKTFDEFNVEEYDCLILPGMYNILPALFDERNIEFLKKLKGKDILISSISSSPILLAKAGLLEDVHFTCGIWDEISQNFDFIPQDNIIHQPVIKDKNFITAIGFAYKEFAIETIRALGIDECRDGLFNGITRDYSEEELTYKMGDDNFRQFLEEYNNYLMDHLE
ncbi:MAG: DJ-1/PfpI family protein [Clostridium sp.]